MAAGVAGAAGGAPAGAVAILAGGKGRRLGGRVKPLIEVDGQRILDRQLAVLRRTFETIALVGGDAAWLGARDADVVVIPDRAGPDLGPLAGLDAALAWLPARFDSVVSVAGDMPFLAGVLLARLRDAPAPSCAAVVPRHARGPEPLCARYHRSIGPLVAGELAARRLSMHGLLARLDERPGAVSWIDESELRALDPELGSFRNVNTADDL